MLGPVTVLIAIAPAVSFGVEFFYCSSCCKLLLFFLLFSAVVFVDVVGIKVLSSLHPSIRHPETDMSRPEFEPPTSSSAGGHPAKELFEQLTY